MAERYIYLISLMQNVLHLLTKGPSPKPQSAGSDSACFCRF